MPGPHPSSSRSRSKRAQRTLTRYRKTQIQEWQLKANRLRKALEDTEIKLRLHRYRHPRSLRPGDARRAGRPALRRDRGTARPFRHRCPAATTISRVAIRTKGSHLQVQYQRLRPRVGHGRVPGGVKHSILVESERGSERPAHGVIPMLCPSLAAWYPGLPGASAYWA